MYYPGSYHLYQQTAAALGAPRHDQRKVVWGVYDESRVNTYPACIRIHVLRTVGLSIVKTLKKKMIAIAADSSENFHDCQTRGFKSACKRLESGASRSPSKSELKVEWRSAPEKKIDMKRRKQSLWNR